MSLSRIIRGGVSGAPLRIGEVHTDVARSKADLDLIYEYFPDVELEITAEGNRVIPAREARKLVKRLVDRGVQEKLSGEEAGRKSGLETGRVESERVVAELSKAIADAVNQRDALLREAETHITDIIFKVAQKVTFQAAQIDPEITSAVVQGAIETLVDKRNITVLVHPDHYQSINDTLDRFKAVSSEIRELKIEADPRISVGGCFIRTPTGDIDARLESQFESIKETMSVA